MKITSATYLHTCPLTTNSHREALQRGGEVLPNIDGVNDIVSMLIYIFYNFSIPVLFCTFELVPSQDLS